MNVFESRRAVEDIVGPVRWFADNAGYCACPDWKNHERVRRLRMYHDEAQREKEPPKWKEPEPLLGETIVQFDPVEIRCLDEMLWGTSTCRLQVERVEKKIRGALAPNRERERKNEN